MERMYPDDRQLARSSCRSGETGCREEHPPAVDLAWAGVVAKLVPGVLWRKDRSTEGAEPNPRRRASAFDRSRGT